VALSAASLGRAVAAERTSMDERLDAARQFVESSDRYLYHGRLEPGMKGYGLTVLSGTKIVRFNVEIVSVMANFGPHQAVVLARLSGQGLEKTGIIAGMSGSPCYVHADGKDKLIGAVAYGWSGQKEPLCGIQPITQMLAMANVPGEGAPTSRPTEVANPVAIGKAPDESGVMKAVLDPEKLDFAQLVAPDLHGRAGEQGATRLAPLATPLAVSGASPRAMSYLTDRLAPAGMIPVQGGSALQVQQVAARTTRLEPGSAVSVPLLMGDASYSAVGTVTDVVGDKVLAFGHSFFGEGEIAYPIATAYVDTVISNIMTSFKLASDLKLTGTLDRDEQVGVAGRIGAVPAMIPMAVRINWTDLPGRQEHYKQAYRFDVVSSRWMTPLMVNLITQDVVWMWREPPEEHTVRHHVRLEFEGLGTYEADNVTSGRAMFSAMSDLSRAIVAMANNDLGTPPKLLSIDLSMQIEKGTLQAEVLDLKLDGEVYRPGQTVTGKLHVQPFRVKRQSIPVSFKLPDDLPEGTYELTACDATTAGKAMVEEMPHRFEPKTVKQLFDAVKLTVRYHNDRLYLRIPLPSGGGLALDHNELPDLPGSKAAIIRQADRLDTAAFSASLEQSEPTPYVLRGSVIAKIEVTKTPRQTLVGSAVGTADAAAVRQ
jgi:hypothetical protein